jgi:hypothetical protein
MYINDEEWALLRLLAPQLNDRLGPLTVYIFTASFMYSDQTWVARMEYTLEGEDSEKDLKSLLMEGKGPVIWNTSVMKPRVFRDRPSIAILRQGLIEMELEGPDAGERTD